MEIKVRYLIAAILITVGCAVLFFLPTYPFIGGFIIFSREMFTDPVDPFRKPEKAKFRIFKATIKKTVIFKTIALLSIFTILIHNIPDEDITPLIGSWYLVLSVWIYLISSLYSELEDKLPNQKLDPTVTTPFEPRKVQGTAGQL